MVLRIVLILNTIIFLSGCLAHSAKVGSYVAGDYPAASVELVAEDMADALAAAYPPGRVSIFIGGGESALGAAMDAALRSRGFTLAADELGANVTVTYVFDRLGGNMWYSRLSVSDGLTVTRTWRQSGENFIAEASARRGSANGQAQ